MKRLDIVLVLIILLVFGVFNNSAISKSKYQSEWKDLIETNQKLIKQEEKDNPKNIKAHFRLGVAYANLGKIDLAKEEFDFLDELDEKKEDKELKKLTKYYEKQLDETSSGPLLLNYLGFAYYADHNYESSLQIFKKIVKKDSENIWSHNYLATVYGKLGKYDKAEKVLKRSMEIRDDDYTHFLLGAVYYKQGSIFKALYHVGKSGSVATKLLD
ncbi:tetratricopeptide repeat protein [Acetohalobium arabaticum]|uniref:peptidylprolyl isomerase n=1 Tax=Acetohalobium arabaticum (strain ATCC 49924 / DSM 5501 / Z-7288) TaxID=574087 RepID=D9QQ95_ACEAZ|nr:tetratricopeptide repeat protein [Acetohalobium arabaticum]ADL12686.1 TPR repeat-containing protein [Acetohalobium arabaticum DSM 5501]